MCDLVIRNGTVVDGSLVPRHSTPEAFGKFLEAEINRWRVLLAGAPRSP